MSETESFGQVMAEMADKVASPYWTDMAERLKRAHDREIRDVSQREFSRGMDAGQHSMDAEHRAVAMRLRGLRFDGGSHENLARIAYAIYPCATGWTCESADGLRDRLIDLLGGVSDDTCGAGCCCAAADCDGDCGLQREEVTNGRVADDCGSDTGCGDGGGDLHMAGVRITDELREWMSTVLTSDDYAWAIADRIDAQFDRICQQQEAVLQSTIDEMAGEIDKMRKEVIELRKQRHNLQVERGDLVCERDELMKQRAEMTAELARRLEQRDAARARTDELSDELLRTRRERDEARDECDRLKRDMLDEWVPRTSYEEKVEKYRRAYMESDAWRKSLQEKLDAMRDAITAALDG